MARMYESSIPGKTEREIWAELHFENARYGRRMGRDAAAEGRCGDKPLVRRMLGRCVYEGHMIALDTDMIGPFSYCADLSVACATIASQNQDEIP